MAERIHIPFLPIPKSQIDSVAEQNWNLENELFKVNPSIKTDQVGLRSCNRLLSNYRQLSHGESVALGIQISKTREDLIGLMSNHQNDLDYDEPYGYLDKLAESADSVDPKVQEYLGQVRSLANQLALGNWRLILKEVAEASKRYSLTPQDEEEMFQVSWIALLRAAEHYDPYKDDGPERGRSFKAFAMYYLRKDIKRYRKETYSMTFSHRDMEKLNLLSRARVFLQNKNPEVTPAFEEVTKVVYALFQLGVKADPRDVETYISENLTNKHTKRYRLYANYHENIAKLLQSLWPMNMDELLAINKAVLTPETDPVQANERRELKRLVKNALEILGQREVDIITMKHGLLDGQEHTHKEIGELFGASPEKIKAIYTRALRKLRHPSLRRPLAAWLGWFD